MKKIKELCGNFGIKHDFPTPKTLQQNGVVEKKNRGLQEMARSMLNSNFICKRFKAKAINTTCYLLT